jgi:broad specificity phosphatase PhoE
LSSNQEVPQNYTITLLRHAESVGNARGYYQGQHDFPLTEKGIQQAESLSYHWQQIGKTIDLVISSPLARARQTAEILSQNLSAPLEIEPIWMERDAGKLSGLTAEEAADKVPRPDFIHVYQPIGIDGESQWQLFLRAGQAIEGLLLRPPGAYLIVSHGGILNMVLYAMLGISPQANFQGAHFHFNNTGYAELIYYPDLSSWVMSAFSENPNWRENEP